MPTQDEEVRITLRLPVSMRDRLTESAAATSRSMNGEILARIEAAEGVRRLLDDFELLKAQYVAQQEREKALKEQVTNMHRITTGAQGINRQLIELLMRRLNVSEEEITAITRSKSGD
ncbi:Arc family DNA-binding protein [Phyllobacterium sp. K27]